MSIQVTSLVNYPLSLSTPSGVVQLNPYKTVRLPQSAATLELSARVRTREVQVTVLADDSDVTESVVSTATAGPLQRRPAPSSIVLPPTMDALWWKLDESSGSPVDQVHGVVLEPVGTVTQLYDNPGGMSLVADTALRLLNSAVAHEVMRIDNLTGSLIVGAGIEGATPGAAGTPYVMGYGDAAQATGFYGFSVGDTHFPTFRYRAPSGSLAGGSNGAGNLRASTKRMFQIVIHRGLLENRIWVDHYVDGWICRSERFPAIEGAQTPPIDYVTRGLRVGARPSGGAGGSTNFYALNVNPQIFSNFHVVRINGDRRSMIPAWIENMNATMPYGLIPEIMNHA